MGKKVLSLILISLLVISSFSFAFGVNNYADRFEGDVFNGLLSSERDVYGDILDTYVSLENKSLITSIVSQFMGNSRYENYDFLIEFIDEDFVVDDENIGGYIRSDNSADFRSSFDTWEGFNTYLGVMDIDVMSTYITRFSVSLYYLDTAKSDGEIASFNSNLFKENSTGNLFVIDSVYEVGGMYDDAEDYLGRIDFTFPDRVTAKAAAEAFVGDYNNASNADQEIIFDFLDNYNLVDEYRRTSSSGGSSTSEEETTTVEVEEGTLNEVIESSDETSEDEAVLAEYIYDGSDDKVEFIIDPEVLSGTGYEEEAAVKLVFGDVEIKLNGDNFEDEDTTKVTVEKTDDDSYVIDSDNELKSPVFVSFPYEGDADYPSVYRYNEDTEEYDLIGGYYDEEEGVVKIAAGSFGEFMIAGSEAVEFEDIDDITWGEEYKDVVKRMSAGGYVQGRGEVFDPYAEVTRAEFSAMLVRLLDMNNYQGDVAFEDVDSDDWFFDEVVAAYNLGLIQGVSETEFKPNESITREEMAVMASRMLKLKYYLGGSELSDSFTDEELIENWAVEGVALVEKLGVMTGRTSGEFDPKGVTTRLEAVVVMERLLSK